MYQVLYRKWRPQVFDDVSGQEHITTTLKNEVASNRINHAYLFTGSRGTGKTTCAKILAKAVNCLDPHNGNPCGKCEICAGIDDGSILDVIEMDAASNRSIDDIRAVIDEAQYKPSRCRYRVFIIDEVHMLTQEAFNALLKTLEEPPEHVIFILATTEVHKILPTIISRCQRFDFHRIRPSDIKDRLLFVARQEDVLLSESAAMLIAAVSDGAMRDALSLLDRCMAISTDIDDDVARAASGLVRQSYLFELAACVINKNTAKSLGIIDSLYSESKDMARLCNELISHFRTLMLIKSVKSPKDIVVMSDDEFEQAQTQSDYLSLADIIYYMDVLSKASQRMGRTTGDRVELETAMVKLTAPELEATWEALTARVTALEKAVKSGIKLAAENNSPLPTEEEESDFDLAEEAELDSIALPQAQNLKPEEEKEQRQTGLRASKPAPPLNKPVQRAAVNLDEIYRNAKPFPQWVEVVESMKPVSRTIAAAFAGTSAYVSGNYILIDTDNNMAFELLRNGSRRDEIRKIIRDTTGHGYNLGPYKKAESKQKEADPVEALKKELEKNGVEITEE